MHFGLVAVKASQSELTAAFPTAWSNWEITKTADGFPDQDAIWKWMSANERFIPAGSWTKEDPGAQCCAFYQDGPWAVLFDPSWLLACDEEALQRLSEACGQTLSFVVESASGCAFFWCYEAGILRRSISRPDSEVEFGGEALAEEQGLDLEGYYIAETEALMRAFGLRTVDASLPPSTTAAVIIDRGDYSSQVAQMRKDRALRPKKANPWWKFW